MKLQSQKSLLEYASFKKYNCSVSISIIAQLFSHNTTTGYINKQTFKAFNDSTTLNLNGYLKI